MYLWTDEGIENLVRQAKDFAEAAAHSGGRDYDEAFLQRMNFYAGRAESAFEKLLSELVVHADPFWPSLPPKVSVPEVKEPTEREVAQVAGPPPRSPEREDFRTDVPEPGMLGRMLGGRTRHETEVRRAQEADEDAFQRARERHDDEVEQWRARLDSARRELLKKREEAAEEAETYNQGIDDAAALRASPTPIFVQKVVRDSILRTFYAVMSNISLPLPGPDYVEITFSDAERRVLVELHVPEADKIVPPRAFELDAEHPIPLPREREEVFEMHRDYAISLALGALHLVAELVEEASMQETIELIAVNGFDEVPLEGDEGVQRRYLVSLEVPAESVEVSSVLDLDPAAGAGTLEARIAEVPGTEGVDPLVPPRPAESSSALPDRTSQSND